MFLGHPVVISHQLSGVKEGVKNPVIESVHELGTLADKKVSLAPPLKILLSKNAVFAQEFGQYH